MRAEPVIDLLYILLATLLVARAANATVCKSATVQSVADLEKLRNCTVVAGHVRLLFMHFTVNDMAQLEPLEIEEITEYLLVYRVHGLDSLFRVFPNLMIIRGATLLYGEYGLVIHENRDLENIGLISLLRIIRGSVRIESNPSLCYTNTINWVEILHGSKKFKYILKNNKPANYCPLCFSAHPADDEHHNHCWSLGYLQQLPQQEYSNRCTTECPSKRCNKNGQCCSSDCLTSCSDVNCQHCVSLTADNKCVKNCKPPYVLAFSKECVKFCETVGQVKLGSECVKDCPTMYKDVTENGILTGCSLNCDGNFTVKSSQDLVGLSECTVLKGSLTLQMRYVNETLVSHLEKAFGNLRKITGYLKIERSPVLVSLNFFRNLDTIGGEYLVDDSYALYVVGNHHLEDLWNPNQKVSIQKGRVFFHLNPRLCYDKIKDLEPQLKMGGNMSVADVSPISNGERVVCGDIIQHLECEVEAVNSTAACISVDLRTSDDLIPHLGYIYLYNEAPQRNVTLYEGRHGCGKDSWYMDVANGTRRRHVISGLKPYTQYAYVVKTLTMVDFHFQKEAISDVQYFRTLPAKPGPLARIYYRSLSAESIELHWWPPRQRNGILKKYLLSYQEADADHQPPAKTTQASNQETCLCPKLDSHSGPMPRDLDYYHRVVQLYEQDTMNFIYVKKVSNGSRKEVVKRDPIEEKNITSRFVRMQEDQRLRTIAEQEEGREDYYIRPTPKICEIDNPSLMYRREHDCEELEEYAFNYELPGNQHTFVLNNLKPKVIYRVGMRACVEGLENGCGPETVLWVETVSKSLSAFLETYKFSLGSEKAQ